MATAVCQDDRALEHVTSIAGNASLFKLDREGATVVGISIAHGLALLVTIKPRTTPLRPSFPCRASTRATRGFWVLTVFLCFLESKPCFDGSFPQTGGIEHADDFVAHDSLPSLGLGAPVIQVRSALTLTLLCYFENNSS